MDDAAAGQRGTRAIASAELERPEPGEAFEKFQNAHGPAVVKDMVASSQIRPWADMLAS